MADLTPIDEWTNIYQLEISDPVLGGPGGISNRQGQQLLNRTERIYQTSLLAGINHVNGTVSDPTTTTKGPTRLSTQAEVNDGVEDTTIVTPLKLQNKFNNYGFPTTVDTSWQNVVLEPTSGFLNSTLQYRFANDKRSVLFRGTFNRPENNSNALITTLPVEYRPIYEPVILKGSCNQTSLIEIYINTTGNITFEIRNDTTIPGGIELVDIQISGVLPLD